MAATDPLLRQVVGVMTGTSIDGIDAALTRIERRGLDMRASLIRHVSAPLGSGLQARLLAAASQQPMTAKEFAQLAWDFGTLHADIVAKLVAGSEPPSLICIHGQTIVHQPPISWQLVNPAPIAARFDRPIVNDLRQADLAHGGQGAPITPIADWILFRDASKRRAIVNLGGFCNVTILPRASETERAGTSSCCTANELGEIAGFDVCACNQLLDAIAREALGKPFDQDGVAASRGRVKPHAAEALREILDRQWRGNRSLGTGDEGLNWINQHRDALAPDDLAASAVAAIAGTIAASISPHTVNEIILAGGGARNLALRNALQKTVAVPLLASDDFGVPIEAREAMCFAILGALCQDGVAITLPLVTGCRAPAPISGLFTPRTSAGSMSDSAGQ